METADALGTPRCTPHVSCFLSYSKSCTPLGMPPNITDFMITAICQTISNTQLSLPFGRLACDQECLCTGEALLPEHLQRLIKVVPQKETDSLRLQWPIAAQQGLYKTHPSSYLSHLMG